MIILVCGGDGTGKTTLCKHLAEHYGFEYKHFDRPVSKEAAKKEYFDYIDYVSENNLNVVCDRMYDGEFVYAPIYRGYKIDYLEEIEEKIKKQVKTVVVYVTADIEDIIHRVTVRGEDFVQLGDHTLIQSLYEEFMQKQTLEAITVNTSVLDEQKAFRYAVECLDKAMRK